MKKQVVETVFDGKQLFYINFGYKFGQGTEPQFRLWIDKSFLTQEDNGWFVEFPIRNCDVMQMDNEKDLVVKPGDLNLFYFYIVPGYKGESVIDIIDTDQPYQSFVFINEDVDDTTTSSKGALILTRSNKVKIRWHRNGKLYDDQLPEGVTILYSDCRRETIPNDKVIEYL